MYKCIKVGEINIANNLPFVLIAGPCQIESYDHAMYTADFINKIALKVGVKLIYKSSFDKANRTSIDAKRGVGLDEALKIFIAIKGKFDLPVITDVHDQTQCKAVGEVVDVIQIPAFLCRQTDLLIAAAKTNKPINIKKGQFLAPWDMKNVAKKISSSGNDNIMLCERGVTFGYNRLISDMRAIDIMAETGYPIVFDATHSVQEPAGEGASSGGQRRFVKTLATAAASIGVAALFVETHQDPDNAPSDGPCMLPFHDLENFLLHVKRFDELAKHLLNDVVKD